MRRSWGMLAARRAAVILGAAASFTLLVAPGAAAPADRVAELRREGGSLQARERAATLELYALETQLRVTRARLAELTRLREAAEAQARSIRIQLDAAWQSAFVAEQRLGERLRALYAAGTVDPVAVLLGAESLDQAISGLEGLRSLAAGDRDLVEQVRRARAELTAARRRVAARTAALRVAESAAEETAASLDAARRRRVAYLAELSAQRGFTARRLQRAQRVARAAAIRPPAQAAPQAAPAVEPTVAPAAAPAPDRSGEWTVTVVATGYAIRGRTSTGVPTGWGVVAVDPAVIPLGSRLTIPGYGDGVAADTGGAVRGATIDVWFPSVEEALAWGRRTVTITVHR